MIYFEKTAFDVNALIHSFNYARNKVPKLDRSIRTITQNKDLQGMIAHSRAHTPKTHKLLSSPKGIIGILLLPGGMPMAAAHILKTAKQFYKLKK